MEKWKKVSACCIWLLLIGCEKETGGKAPDAGAADAAGADAGKDARPEPFDGEGAPCLMTEECIQGECYRTYVGNFCARTCEYEVDCPEEYSCSILSDVQAGLKSICHDTGGKREAGMPCDAETVGKCKSRICIDGKCSLSCRDNGDCPGTMVCADLLSSGLELKRCVPEGFTPKAEGEQCGADSECESGLCWWYCTKPCGANSECSEGWYCGPMPTPWNTMVFVCNSAEKDGYGPGKKGDECGQDSDCVTGLCIEGIKKCGVMCQGEADCDGEPCREYADMFVPGRGSTGMLHACIPAESRRNDYEECDYNFQCPAEVCTDGICVAACESSSECRDGHACCHVATTATDVKKRCTVNDSGVTTVTECGGPGDCPCGSCVSRLNGAGGFCAIPCGANEDCPQGFACVEIRDGEYRSMYCWPSNEPHDLGFGERCVASGNCEDGICAGSNGLICTMACRREGECPEGFHCAPVNAPFGVFFECLAEQGQKAMGEQCADDAECANMLCYDGACSGPCITDFDCPGGLKCELQYFGIWDVMLCI